MTNENEMLALIERTHLENGSHNDFADGCCAMELVSYIVGEPFSDHPECVCPVLGAFVRTWNDRLPDDERDVILKPILPRLIGTRGSHQLAERRALMAVNWLVRVYAPTWLRLAKLDAHADALEALPAITAFDQLPSIRDPAHAARVAALAVWDAAWVAARVAVWDAGNAVWDAARVAARDAAGDVTLAAAREAARATLAAAWEAARATLAAAWDAARVAAREAAWVAAWDAARAAWDAAGDAAWDAAGDATLAAAREAAREATLAARDALKETYSEIQRSAIDLMDRMIEIHD